MIICLAGTKGGSGRSTTATNFACIAAGQGMKVLMVDAGGTQTGSSGRAELYLHKAHGPSRAN